MNAVNLANCVLRPYQTYSTERSLRSESHFVHAGVQVTQDDYTTKGLVARETDDGTTSIHNFTPLSVGRPMHCHKHENIVVTSQQSIVQASPNCVRSLHRTH